MKNKFIFYLIEYLSLALVLSFFIMHNIYLEFIGVGLAFLSINKKIETYKKVIHNLQDENKKLSKLLSNREKIESLV